MGAQIIDSCARICDLGPQIIDFGARIYDLGAYIIDFGARICDLGAQIIDSGARIYDLGMVWLLGMAVPCPESVWAPKQQLMRHAALPLYKRGIVPRRYRLSIDRDYSQQFGT